MLDRRIRLLPGRFTLTPYSQDISMMLGGGHTRYRYYVTQHGELVAKLWLTNTNEWWLYALMDSRRINDLHYVGTYPFCEVALIELELWRINKGLVRVRAI